jgi:general secretion pathway protein F
MTTVAPEMAAMFEATGRPLPQLTQIMLGITGWISGNIVPLGLGLAATVIGVTFALRVPRIRDGWHDFLLGVPIAGKLMTLDAANQYLRTLSLVVSSRQPVVEGVESATDVLSIRRFREESQAATRAIRAGATLSSALGETSFVPPVARQLVEAGEKSARVAQMTERAAMLVETWLVNDRKRIATLLDPALMMLVGLFVLIVVLSVLLPVFDMQSAISV